MTKEHFLIDSIDFTDIIDLQKTIMLDQEYSNLYIEETLGMNCFLGMSEKVGPLFYINRGAGLHLRNQDKNMFFCREINQSSDIILLYKQVSNNTKPRCINGKKKLYNIESPRVYFNYNNILIKEVFEDLLIYASKQLKLVDLSCFITLSAKKVIILDNNIQLKQYTDSKVKIKINAIFKRENELFNRSVKHYTKKGWNNIDCIILDTGKRFIDQFKTLYKPKTINDYEMDFVLAPGAGGIFIHETCGHALEGDAIFQKESIFTSKINKRVAPDNITIIDRGTCENDWVYEPYDSEGVCARDLSLIQNGYINAIMTDRETAKKLGLPCSGNARRESFEYQPICRMRNTFLAPGDFLPQDIIKNTKKGIYATDFTGGDVNTITGDFTFGINSGFLIENGELTNPIRPFLYAGNTIDVLNRVDLIGNDLQFEYAECGKNGQMVDVSYGQPTLRIRGHK